MTLTKEQINHMADRFCAWPLPENFNPDGGVSYERFGNKGTAREFRRDTSGTNLFSHEQAKEMICYMLEGLPQSELEKDRPEVVTVEQVKEKLREYLPEKYACYALEVLDVEYQGNLRIV